MPVPHWSVGHRRCSQIAKTHGLARPKIARVSANLVAPLVAARYFSPKPWSLPCGSALPATPIIFRRKLSRFPQFSMVSRPENHRKCQIFPLSLAWFHETSAENIDHSPVHRSIASTKIPRIFSRSSVRRCP